MPIINSVISGGGTTPTGTKQITSNGTHDVAAYEYADVNVPTTAPALYREYSIGTNGDLRADATTTHVMNFAGIKTITRYYLAATYYYNTGITGAISMPDLTEVSDYGCYQMFSHCTGITSVSLPSLQYSSVSGCAEMFSACSNITSAYLPSLKKAGSYGFQLMFGNCTGLTSIDLPALAEGLNYGLNSMFSSCTGLTSINLPVLTIVGANTCRYMFYNCPLLTNVVLPSLAVLNYTSACLSMFEGCTNLASLSLPSINTNSFGNVTNVFGSLCKDVSNVTLHFPSNVQAKVEALTGYSTTAPFGAVAGTVLFDLPATYTLTGADTNTYTRNPKEDTGTALAWKEGAYGTTNFATAYYTSGTSDPTVGATIYSDSACTTAVTTISSIA